LLNQDTETGLELDEVAVVVGLIVPLVELMPARGGDYLRFLSQAYVTEPPDSAYRSAVEVDRDVRRYYLNPEPDMIHTRAERSPYDIMSEKSCGNRG